MSPDLEVSAEDGKVQKWMHSSILALIKMIEEKDMGCRYYELSNAKLGPQCILVCIEISEEFIIEEATEAMNGYAHSISVKSTFPWRKLMSASLSEEPLRLTRASVSHFECFLQCGAMTDYNLVTAEVPQALMMEMLHSCKIRANLKAQSPELHDRLMGVISECKAEWMTEMSTGSNSRTSNTATTATTITIHLADSMQRARSVIRQGGSYRAAGDCSDSVPLFDVA
eukprot:3541973-Amphidinium_carterae.1